MTTPAVPYYRPVRDECAIFEHAHRQQLPLLLKGPTGCGKSRFVEAMAAKLGRPLVTVACHDETSAVDLAGRHLIRGGETVWQDGPVTRAVRQGAILYLDEIAEARPDVIVVLHPLSDHRRRIVLEGHDEEVVAADGFMLVVSFNPGYQRGMKELKPSTRQRFIAMAFDYPSPELEAEIVLGEVGCEPKVAKRLAMLAQKLRTLDALGLAELPSTRLMVDAAKLIRSGVEPRRACDVAIVQPLTDDPAIASALRDVVALAL
jgi:nitric oxide reductase NorQ protein